MLEMGAQGCAQILTQLGEIHGDERAARALAYQADAVLALLHLRLRDLGRLLRGELDPAALAAPHNVVPHEGEPTHTGGDVLFSPRRSRR